MTLAPAPTMRLQKVVMLWHYEIVLRGMRQGKASLFASRPRFPRSELLQNLSSAGKGSLRLVFWPILKPSLHQQTNLAFSHRCGRTFCDIKPLQLYSSQWAGYVSSLPYLPVICIRYEQSRRIGSDLDVNHPPLSYTISAEINVSLQSLGFRAGRCVDNPCHSSLQSCKAPRSHFNLVCTRAAEALQSQLSYYPNEMSY
ncbi:hypothetical protein BDW69DRAFT_35808 [Aspergillus filifer]